MASRRSQRLSPISTFFSLFLLLLPAALAASEDTPEPRTAAAEVEPSPEPPPLTVNEPIYFIVGWESGEAVARFQLSLKYRIFDADGFVVQKAPWLERLHFAYTQTSLWNLSADSKPFEDSSYRPSLFWEFETPRTGLLPDLLRFGYEHESNGQAGPTSRSIDTLFVFPAWETHLGGRNLLVGTKLYAYVNQGDENSDIEDYRGYSDLVVRYGHDDGWQAALLWRHGWKNRDTLQLDLSYPLRKKFLARAGGYVYMQIFQGYGESLLTYNKNESLQVRLGLAIVR